MRVVAVGTTVVLKVVSLFAEFASISALAMEATLVSVPVAVEPTVAWKVWDPLEPSGSDPRCQMIWLPTTETRVQVPVQLALPGTYVNPVGNVSVNSTPVAGDGLVPPEVFPYVRV